MTWLRNRRFPTPVRTITLLAVFSLGGWVAAAASGWWATTMVPPEQFATALAENQSALDAAQADIEALAARVETLVLAKSVAEQRADEAERRSADLSAALEEEQARVGMLAGSLRSVYSGALDQWARSERIASDRTSLTAEVAILRGRLDGLRIEQQELLAQLRERTDIHVAGMEESLAYTGLDIDNLIQRLRGGVTPTTAGVGGPLIPLPPSPPDMKDEDGDTPGAELVNLVDRAGDLRDVANQLPLSMPILDDYRRSSGFGARTDPFTGRRSGHEGLDFAARSRTPIHASAAGTVAFAGRHGAYGNMVDIDHGLGVVTRYAHMHDIDVAVGETVQAGDVIGRVGSTGRSSGPHVHYEIIVDDSPRNPANFIRAGRSLIDLQE